MHERPRTLLRNAPLHDTSELVLLERIERLRPRHAGVAAAGRNLRTVEERRRAGGERMQPLNRPVVRRAHLVEPLLRSVGDHDDERAVLLFVAAMFADVAGGLTRGQRSVALEPGRVDEPVVADVEIELAVLFGDLLQFVVTVVEESGSMTIPAEPKPLARLLIVDAGGRKLIGEPLLEVGAVCDHPLHRIGREIVDRVVVQHRLATLVVAPVRGRPESGVEVRARELVETGHGFFSCVVFEVFDLALTITGSRFAPS